MCRPRRNWIEPSPFICPCRLVEQRRQLGERRAERDERDGHPVDQGGVRLVSSSTRRLRRPRRAKARRPETPSVRTDDVLSIFSSSIEHLHAPSDAAGTGTASPQQPHAAARRPQREPAERDSDTAARRANCRSDLGVVLPCHGRGSGGAADDRAPINLQNFAARKDRRFFQTSKENTDPEIENARKLLARVADGRRIHILQTDRTSRPLPCGRASDRPEIHTQ